MPRAFWPVGRRPRPDLRVRDARLPIDGDDRAGLNDLFALFPELPPFPHRPPARQVRGVRKDIERVEQRTGESVGGHRAAAARVRGSGRRSGTAD